MGGEGVGEFFFGDDSDLFRDDDVVGSVVGGGGVEGFDDRVVGGVVFNVGYFYDGRIVVC